MQTDNNLIQHCMNGAQACYSHYCFLFFFLFKYPFFIHAEKILTGLVLEMMSED